ncbi:MAG: glutamine amidotransferase [Verrucomicrobiales bacterium]|nr:glutamine amidotransferase [Verrucomicrobiales bacterium]
MIKFYPLFVEEMFSIQASSLVLANPQWLWMASLLTAGGIAFLVWNYRNSQLALPWKSLAIALKTAAFVLLALALLEPVWVDEFPRNGANDLVVMADNSRGLTIEGQGDALQKALIHSTPDQLPPWLEKLNEMFRVQNYQFGRRLNRVDDFSNLDFTGDASSVLTSLKSLRTRYKKRPLAAMVIFTDGNATDTAALESTIATLRGSDEDKPIPVFPVLVGTELKDISDLAIREIEVSQSAFEDAPLTIAVQSDARGTFEQGVEIFAVDDNGKEVASEPIIFAGEEVIRTGATRLKIAGVRPGISFYKIGIRSLQADGVTPVKEVTAENNQRLVAVDRGRGPYRVLYVGGRPNWEYKFLRRSLSEDSEVELVALLRIAKREPKFEWRGRTGETGNPLFRGFGKDLPEETQSYDEPVLIRLNTKDEVELRDGFPRDAETLFANYRAIIFDDAESDFLSAEQQALVENFVSKRGGTLLMLGGQESFKSGGWDNTPVARVLPVYVDRLERGGPSRNATFNLSREGWLEPWMRLRDNQDEETGRLAYMPEFFSINRVPAIKPGASLLATITDSERRQLPAVVVQRYGEGRSGAVTVGDFWRWGMKDELLQKDLAKMWRQLIRWAVSETPGRLTQEIQHVTEGTLPLTQIHARVRNLEFLPQDDASVRFELLSPGKEEPDTITGEPSLEEAGTFTADHFVEAEGGYRLKTIARDGEGKLISELETGWAFNPAAEEFKSLDPNRALLENIASTTGGKVMTLDQIDELASRLKELNVPVMDSRQRPFWHAPWVFFLALLCMVGEWGIRRWKGVI